jgi:GTP 3',8-cyclase
MSELVDPFERRITYLRLSVTDRCNLRCTYCMAEEMEFLPKDRVLNLEEIQRIAACFVELGIRKIRLTGGEPLVRRGIAELSASISALEGLEELTMTTNAVLLDKFAKPLSDAGIRRLNISIDSLKPERFKAMTRIGELSAVLKGIEAARLQGFQAIKLNVVVLAGQNDDEVVDLAEFAIDRGLDISYIEEMPLGHITSHQRADTQHKSIDIRHELQQKFAMTPSTETTGGPSRYYRLTGSNSKIGFISPMSDNFCSSCNRVRLTTEGRLLLCLGNEHSVDLREPLRDGASNQEMKSIIEKAISIKPERHYFDPDDTQILRFMSATGG